MDGWKTRNSAGKFDFGTVSRDLATSVAKELIIGVEKRQWPLDLHQGAIVYQALLLISGALLEVVVELELGGMWT